MQAIVPFFKIGPKLSQGKIVIKSILQILKQLLLPRFYIFFQKFL